MAEKSKNNNEKNLSSDVKKDGDTSASSQKSLKQKKAQAEKSNKNTTKKDKSKTKNENSSTKSRKKTEEKNQGSETSSKEKSDNDSTPKDTKPKKGDKEVDSNSSSNGKSNNKEKPEPSSKEKEKKDNKKSSSSKNQGKHTADSLAEIDALRGVAFIASAEEESSKENNNEQPDTESVQPVDPAKEQKMQEILGKHEQRMQQMKRDKKEKEKRAKRNKIIAICACAVATVYILGAILFSFITYPNTYLADNDLSFKTEGALQNALEQVSDKYTLNVTGIGMNLEISGESINYDFDAKNVKNLIWEKKNPLIWPFAIFSEHSFKDDYVVSFSPEKLLAIVAPAVEGHNATAIPPSNAGFNVDLSTKTASVKPEVCGTTLDGQKTYSAIESCVGSSTQSLELTSDQQVLPTVYAEDKRMDNALAQANKMLQTTITLIMGNTNVSTLAPATFGPWIEVSPEYNAILNQLQLINWTEQLANECNTAGSTRTFTTPYGKQVSVSGSIGWEIDEPGLVSAINERIYSGTAVSLEVPCSSSLESYGGKGGKDWGNRYIDVDISSQTVRMYDEAGNQIFSAACVTGKPSTPTPTGLFTVYSKASPTVLHADDGSYHTPVQYWMPFSGGCGFHDATWQSGFGGDRWQTGAGSHGCVNLSSGSAAQLYSLCKTGDIVVVHN